MKKIKLILLGAALILLMVSGCGVKPVSSPDNPIAPRGASAGEDAVPQAGASNQPIIAVSDEKSHSLHSGELLAKDGSIIIYVGEHDNIYRVDTETNENRLLVKCSRPQKLYFDGTYVYYMPYYQMGRGIYRASLTGEVEKICDNSSIQLWLTDEKIYFTDQIGFDNINGTPQGNLCSMDKDGSNIRILLENVKNYFYIQDQWIYFTDLNSRGLYRAKLDGSGRQLLASGRTYINAVGGGYVIYADYADGETFHLVNVQTGENTVLGQFGFSRRYNGETYVQTREKDAAGVPAMTAWSVLRLNEDTGKTEKRAALNISEVGIDTMQYVYDNWIYLYSTGAGNGQEKGAYRVKLSPGLYEKEHVADPYLYYLDGYGYYIEQDEAYRQTGFARINLKTGEVTTWPLQ